MEWVLPKRHRQGDPTDGPTDGPMHVLKDKLTDRPLNTKMPLLSYRDARTHLEIEISYQIYSTERQVKSTKTLRVLFGTSRNQRWNPER